MDPIAIPTLRTPRLTLRAFRPDDLARHAGMLGDPAVVRFLGTGTPRNGAESWEVMARAIGQWALRGYGLFALEHEGRFAGHAGFSSALLAGAGARYAIAPDLQRRGLRARPAARCAPGRRRKGSPTS
jgi:RimJ/RimL family protein N-acetyltransferase